MKMKKNVKNGAERERKNERERERECLRIQVFFLCLTSFWVNLRSGIFHEWTKQSVNPRLNSRHESHENDFGSWCEWLYENDFRRKTRRKRGHQRERTF